MTSRRVKSLPVLASEPLFDGLPALYRSLLPVQLALDPPRETLATCGDCPMTVAVEGGVSMSPATKCCTYQPVVPNYLVGALLADRNPASREGRLRVRARIAHGGGATPLALRPPPKLELLCGAMQKGSLGRAPSLVCGYYDAGSGACTIWPFREAVCSTFFCKHVTGHRGHTFWLALRAFLRRVEAALSRHALARVAPELLEADATTTRERDSALTAEDLEGLSPPPEERALRWGAFLHREEELYVATFEAVRSLGRAGLERLLGRDDRRAIAAVREAHEASVRPRLPARLILAPGLAPQPLHGGKVAVVGYSRFDPLELTDTLLGALAEVSGDEDLTPQLARLEARGLTLADESISTLHAHRVLVPPPVGERASLADVLAYRNPRVVRGFLRTYDVAPREARAIFVETLKLLWLAGTGDEPLPIVPPMRALDEMWHAFILHTRNYAQFCATHFGRFIHHDPETRGRARPSAPVSAAELERLVARVYFGLGPETARLWFEKFATKYDDAFFEAARRRRRASRRSASSRRGGRLDPARSRRA
jgi:hypothetical protein